MNKNLEKFEVDWLFHFGLEFPRDKKLFEGVKFICTGGSESRLTKFTTLVATELGTLENYNYFFQIVFKAMILSLKIWPLEGDIVYIRLGQYWL